ncbi:hypothetical protein DFH28DRAFT_1126138 [Melampsora americana]|nr:hypothetical protein DFH28DRAFT_1126138 [Melampsora americana]
MSTSIKQLQFSPSSPCPPSSDLKDLLVARARIHPHFNQTYLKSLHSPGSESVLPPSPISTIKPSTPSSTVKVDSSSILQTPASITITEGSQYSPSCLNVDPDSETLQDIKSDRLSITSDSPNSSYSPIIIKARRTIAVDISQSLENLEIRENLETKEGCNAEPSEVHSPISLQEFLISGASPRPISPPQDMSDEMSPMKTFLGPKLTRHGDAPWSATSMSDGDSNEGGNQSDPVLHRIPSPSASLRQIPSAFSHVLTGGARRNGARGREASSSGGVLFDIVDPPVPKASEMASSSTDSAKDEDLNPSSTITAVGVSRSTSTSSNSISRPSTSVTTPSTSWSSLPSATGNSQTAKLVDDKTTRPPPTNKSVLSSSTPTQTVLPSLPLPRQSADSRRSQSVEPNSSASPLLKDQPQSSSVENFPVDAATNYPELAPRSVTPSSLSGKMPKKKKSAGFLRSLKKAVGSVTHDEIRSVSGPVGQVIRNGGADPMPAARPLPSGLTSAPVPRIRNKSFGGKLAAFAAQQQQSNLNNNGVEQLSVPLPANLHQRRNQLNPLEHQTLNLRPISMAFSAGFSAELLLQSSESEQNQFSPSLFKCDSSSGESDMSALPSPTHAFSSMSTSSVPNSNHASKSTGPKKNKQDEVNQLEIQLRSLKDEIALLKAERENYSNTFFHNEIIDQESKCEKCGCSGRCSAIKVSVLDRPRMKGSTGTPLLFTSGRDYL